LSVRLRCSVSECCLDAVWMLAEKPLELRPVSPTGLFGFGLLDKCKKEWFILKKCRDFFIYCCGL